MATFIVCNVMFVVFVISCHLRLPHPRLNYIYVILILSCFVLTGLFTSAVAWCTLERQHAHPKRWVIGVYCSSNSWDKTLQISWTNGGRFDFLRPTCLRLRERNPEGAQRIREARFARSLRWLIQTVMAVILRPLSRETQVHSQRCRMWTIVAMKLAGRATSNHLCQGGAGKNTIAFWRAD